MWQHLLLFNSVLIRVRENTESSAFTAHVMNRFCLLQRFPFTEGQGSASFVQNCFVPRKLAPHAQNGCLAKWLLCDIMITFRFGFQVWSSCFQTPFWTKCWFKAAKVHSLFTDRPNNEKMNYRETRCDMGFMGACNKMCAFVKFSDCVCVYV